MSGNRWSISRLVGNSQSTDNRTTTHHHTSARQIRPSPAQQTRSPSVQQHSHSLGQHSSSGPPASRSSSGTQSAGGSRASRTSPRQEPTNLSDYSTPAVPDSLWFASDFMLGAGMVVIHPSSGKIVVLREPYQDLQGKTHYRYFLPKGRKDVGESLEQTAIREAYEESGLRVTFLPIILRHNAPSPQMSRDFRRLLPCTEPIYISMYEYGPRDGGRNRRPGEYLTFWYVGEADDTRVESGTRMPDEVDYETCFMTHQEAVSALYGEYEYIVNMAYEHWLYTIKVQADPAYQRHLSQLAEEEARHVADMEPSTTVTAETGNDEAGRGRM